MRNFEVLKDYFLGKDPQLKETMADNSLRLIGIEGKHFVLRSELIQRLNELKEDLDAVDQELADAINGLAESLSADIEALQEADRTMQGDIGSLDLRTDTLEYWKNNNNFVMLEDLNTRLANYYTKAQVDSLIAAIPTLTYEIVQTLPTEDISTRTIYLVPSQDPEQGNYYEEYMYISNTWELIGTTAVDLSNYYTKSEVDAKMTITKLAQDITVEDGVPLVVGLPATGWYNTGTHVVYNGNHETMCHQNTIFYYNRDENEDAGNFLYFLPATLEGRDSLLHLTLYYDDSDNIWQYGGFDVTDTLNSSSQWYSIPNAAVTYAALSGKQDKITLTADATYFVNEMHEGVYVIPFSPGTTIYANNTSISPQDVIFTSSEAIPPSGIRRSGAVMFVEEIMDSPSGTPVYPIPRKYTIFSNNTLIWGEATDTTHTRNVTELGKLQTTDNLVTTINSSSTNTQYPSAAATYTALSGKQDVITLTAGGSYNILDLNPGVYVIPYNTSANTRIYDKSNGTLLFQTSVVSYTQPITTNYYSGVLLVDHSIVNSSWFSTDSKSYEIIGNASITYGNVTSSNYTKNTLGLSQIQKTTNLVTTISSSSTNTQYPSAKAVYDNLPTTFTGTDGQTAGAGGLVPAPATTDVDKYLKSDGTWAAAGGGNANISYGTTDLTPGVSPLNEGEVYFCYE